MRRTTPTTAPYGTWPSPLSADALAGSAIAFADLVVDGDDVLWIQQEARLQGRGAVMRHSPGGGVTQLTPDDFNARTRVHEYGGGALAAGHGVVLACSWADQRVHRIVHGRTEPVTPAPATPAGIRWQAMRILPGGGAFVAVRETHGPDRPRSNPNVHGAEEAVNELVRVDLATGSVTVLDTGSDFVGGPWLSPSGRRIAWLRWDHPHMPWDTAALWVADLADDGLRDATHVAGGDSAVSEARWLDDQRLAFTDDASGWWNVHLWDGERVTRLHDEPVDAGTPRWQPGTDRIAPLGGRLYVAVIDAGLMHVRDLGEPPETSPTATPASSTPIDLDGIASIQCLDVAGDRLVAIAGGPATPNAVIAIDPTARTTAPLSTVQDDPAAAIGATPRPISFPTPDGATAHALHYPPTSRTHVGPPDEAPPLVVLSHGGPTGGARAALNPTAQYWASRGFAVVDVNYRGSAGYGRAFRDALKGSWGIHDVTDCVAAATHLVAEGHADGDRLIIEGGSAGGYTTLMALCTTDVFAAGGNSFGVSDLRALATDTHKFESRYLDSLIGPWPEEEARYVERSPITHVDRLTTPTIVLQGDEDAVVPPSQSEVIVDALRRRGLPHAYLLFAGEQHGFRQAANIARAFEARLAFYGRVLGFDPADDIDLPEFVPGTASG
ncbi:prolyl oligopeptidase family serine peptidase [Euzebya sp.]|uniref:S9 family peptidase n=1 Tax=Euzebya sp. TaxID=1971409 RepID=UPI0035176F71